MESLEWSDKLHGSALNHQRQFLHLDRQRFNFDELRGSSGDQRHYLLLRGSSRQCGGHKREFQPSFSNSISAFVVAEWVCLSACDNDLSYAGGEHRSTEFSCVDCRDI